MKRLMVAILILLMASPVFANESREAAPARLDAACEVARQKKLAPMRKKFEDECVATKEQPSRAECERFYADYGGRMGGRAPLFYDLTECVAAFKFLQGNQNPDT